MNRRKGKITEKANNLLYFLLAYWLSFSLFFFIRGVSKWMWKSGKNVNTLIGIGFTSRSSFIASRSSAGYGHSQNYSSNRPKRNTRCIGWIG